MATPVREALEKEFDEMDTDKSGYLDQKEMEAALQSLGYKLSPEQSKALFQTIDASGDGKISKKEFVTAMEANLEDATHQEAMLRRTFNAYDKDNSGTIEIGELGQIFEDLGIEMPDEKLKKIMDVLDTDGSGSLDFDEFLKAFAE